MSSNSNEHYWFLFSIYLIEPQLPPICVFHTPPHHDHHDAQCDHDGTPLAHLQLRFILFFKKNTSFFIVFILLLFREMARLRRERRAREEAIAMGVLDASEL